MSVPGAPPRHPYQYLDSYVSDLPAVIDLQAIRESKVRIGVDPLGGASVAYWDAIGERYGLEYGGREPRPSIRPSAS